MIICVGIVPTMPRPSCNPAVDVHIENFSFIFYPLPRFPRGKKKIKFFLFDLLTF
jgi:hypothetical protein